ncbi:hypothetical protein BC834DRAFT_546297 [Gloeopeniophorella convolvens]|nr:hypothetical protein BC834DRAFT_546297 [Gloeopeniophorella convolvens]
MADPNFSRHRQSIVDIQQELDDIFREHPECYTNEAGVTSLPARCLKDVFGTYLEEYGVELLTPDEMTSFMQIVAASPGVEATPDTILQLVAMRTSSGSQSNPEEHNASLDGGERGRTGERDHHRHSRSSSSASTGTYYQPTSDSRPPSRPSSRGAGGVPRTPGSKESPFDAQKRQRSIPLGPVAPSSWTRRPAAPGRRKSDASNHGRPTSDSESPSALGQSTSGRRSRAPSNPSTPGYALSPTSSQGAIGSPPLGAVGSRPHSRAQSQPQPQYAYTSPPHLDLSRAVYDAFEESIDKLPMPRMSPDSDSDESDHEPSLGRVFDRSAASSTASLEPFERLEALQRLNQDLGKKLMDAEKTLQRKLQDHEVELEEMEVRLEEVKSELSAAKREEKELRNKERSNQTQISMLESEVAKVQKTLDSSRGMYNSLQKQYQEQLAESEGLRNTLRRKDEEIRTLMDTLSLQQIETNKYIKENGTFEERIVVLEQDLALAQEAQQDLKEQKQENLMLKETIDRMRFDMDDMRAGLTNNAAPPAGVNSAPGSVSKSLGAELLSKMKTGWIDEDEEDSVATLKELGIEDEDEDTEDEDIVQTIITRTKKRGLSKANRMEASFTLEDHREYADAYTQYDSTPFVKESTTQTESGPKVLTASLHTQTDPPPLAVSAPTQTTPPIPRVTTEMEIQTDEPETPRSPSPQEDDDTLASSSSTVLPPTPKAKSTPLDLLAPNSPTDLPPSYNQVTSEPPLHDILNLLDTEDLSFSHIPDLQRRHDLRIAFEALRSWHNGLKTPLRSREGVSAEALEDWRAVKAEVGIGCRVIDQALEDATADGVSSRRRKSSRFYNIYNTYVYGDNGSGKMPGGGFVSHALLCASASAIVVFAMSPFLAHQYAVPGGPTYYDRAAWSSFNTMHPAGEGFPGDGTTAVWNFISRLGGGAARIARGWPT